MYALDGSVNIGAFDIKFGLVVSVGKGGIGEELVPILFVQVLAEDVVHALALLCQLAQRSDPIDELGPIERERIDGVPVTVPEDLLHVDQLGLLRENLLEEAEQEHCQQDHSCGF